MFDLSQNSAAGFWYNGEKTGKNVVDKSRKFAIMIRKTQLLWKVCQGECVVDWKRISDE